MKSKRLYQEQFRYWQVFLCLVNASFASIALVSYLSMCIIVVTQVFCIIKLRNQLNIFLIAFLCNVLINALGMNRALMKLVISCSNNSSGCRRSFEQNDLSRSKHDLMFWKSCPRLEIRVGQLFTIQSKGFLLKMYGDVMLGTSIDLLLAFW